MALVSVSVIAWFARHGGSAGENWFKCYFAPGMAATALGTTVVLAVLHFDLVVGGAPGQNLVLLTVLAVSAVAGVGLALYLKAARPRTFAGLGQTAG